jgi:F-type H+-transporting ATPase subunit delta
MKISRQARRQARELYYLCQVDGTLDEGRVRRVVGSLVEQGRPRALAVLSRFARLVKLDRARHSARVESATPLPPDIRDRLAAGLAEMRGGRELTTSFAENPSLLGGVRVKVGSDVYDGSIEGRLKALQSRF